LGPFLYFSLLLLEVFFSRLTLYLLTMESPTRLVLVVGGTGGVGRHVVRGLLREVGDGGSPRWGVRVLSRNANRARELFAKTSDEAQEVEVEVVEGDTASNKGLAEATAGVDAIICARFSSSFAPSLFVFLLICGCASGGSGLGSNSPKQVDFVGVGHLVAAATSSGVKTFVLVSSGMAKAAGRAISPPWADHGMQRVSPRA
jgi:nucleoside-diphosphate-sugar epimerase